ncbi:MAG: hypothetical protein L0Y72_22770 [Gemmataceae bacterium]|nr:hypothetical protein [Gemmataceae bacterium]MCI0741867.1 hypothetical protein [Gemmataceae bacterium]
MSRALWGMLLAASLASASSLSGAQSPLRGAIKHRAVAELPLPRDRTSFGIGEQVEFFIDPPHAEGPEAVIAWHVNGAATVDPIVGTSTIVTLALTREAGTFVVGAARRDAALQADGQSNGKTENTQLRDWVRKQAAVFPKVERQPVEGAAPAAIELPKELRAELVRMDGMRKGFDTKLDEVDELGRTLLEKYTDPKERGQIYYWLAHVHGQSGLRKPEKVVEYAKKGLELPIELLQVPTLYCYWGDAVQIARSGAREPVPARRKWSAVVYLAGLREMLRYPLPHKAPELPAVGRGLVRNALPGENEVILKQQAKQIAARRFAEFQREMIWKRDILVGQIAAMYQHPPDAPEELRELATGVLRDPRDVERFLRAVKGGRWDP